MDSLGLPGNSFGTHSSKEPKHDVTQCFSNQSLRNPRVLGTRVLEDLRTGLRTVALKNFNMMYGSAS